MTNELLRETRAAELGIHPPPQTITCRKHGLVHAVSYVKHCPDELSCGCAYIPSGAQRCSDCGWPVGVEPAMGENFNYAFCGDGRHGCLAVEREAERCADEIYRHPVGG